MKLKMKIVCKRQIHYLHHICRPYNFKISHCKTKVVTFLLNFQYFQNSCWGWDLRTDIRISFNDCDISYEHHEDKNKRLGMYRIIRGTIQQKQNMTETEIKFHKIMAKAVSWTGTMICKEK